MSTNVRLPPQRRRAALEQLSRDRLISITEHFGLDVGDRRVIGNHIDALVRSKSVDFAELLGLLKRASSGEVLDESMWSRTSAARLGRRIGVGCPRDGGVRRQ